MFTAADAAILHDQLGPIDFLQPTQHRQVINAYLQHYQLPCESAGLPVQHHIGYFQSQGWRIACQYFCPGENSSGKVVILVHGYFDHVGLYHHLIKFLLGLGIPVLAFDLPGHGLSSGKKVSIESFHQYFRVVQDCVSQATPVLANKSKIFLGQSTGASALISGLLQGEGYAETSDKIILLAPLVRPVQWLRVKVMYFFLHKFVDRVKRDFVDSSHDAEFLQFVKTKDPFQSNFVATEWVRALLLFLSAFKRAPKIETPIHVIQGTNDGTVDWHKNMRLLKDKFPAAAICMVDGARHHMVNESVEYREKIFTEIERIANG